MKISEILNQIDLGSYALPEFQRGYVWNRDQVKKLMMSLGNHALCVLGSMGHSSKTRSLQKRGKQF